MFVFMMFLLIAANNVDYDVTTIYKMTDKYFTDENGLYLWFVLTKTVYSSLLSK